MRRLMNSTECFDPGAGFARLVRARVRASYLASRWVQAPIFVPREADT